MKHHIPDALLSQLGDLVAVQVGLNFPRERWHDLERGIVSAAREFGFKDPESCIQWLLSSHLTKNQIEILASHLTVGETYFFRDKKSFLSLENHVLYGLISARRNSERRLRIWSAGCATGEEPYSIAILLTKMIPDARDWNITILATDINPHFLKKASKGIYNEWSFRDTPLWVKENFFEKTKDGHLKVHPHIKKMITFSYLNLVEDSYPSLLNSTNAIDIIFCRNVLMYFTPENINKVVQKLHNSLMDGGWLIVSPCEISKALSSQFVTVNFPDTIFYRKQKIEEQAYAWHREPASEKPEVILPVFPVHEIPYTPPLAGSEPYKEKETEDIRDAAQQLTPYEEALSLYAQSRYAEAAEKITMLLSQKQDDKEALILLSRIHANQGRLADALEWCEKAIITDKMNPYFHYLRATILQEQGQFEESARALKRALYLDYSFVLAHFALGTLCRKKRRLKEADKHFKNALSVLNAGPEENILPEAEGITAKRLKEIIASTMLET